MTGYIKGFIMGAISEEAELRMTRDGGYVTYFTVECRERISGREYVTAARCSAYGRSAVEISKHYRKGDAIALTFNLREHGGEYSFCVRDVLAFGYMENDEGSER